MMYTENIVFHILVAISITQGFLLPNDIEFEEEEGPESTVQERWFEQPLDHFNVQDNRTFLMRYIEDDTYFRRGGPLLLEIGGESEISIITVRQSQSFELAKQLCAKVILLEHRYYGESSPFKNLTANNLVYLSVEQALEDIANFVDTLKETRAELRYSKVAAFGCSYSGSLATWFRYKYPHLVDAVWASSAPLRAVADFYEYLEVATEVYSNVSWNCYNTIKEGYANIKQMLSTHKGGQKVKQALEKWSCGNINKMSHADILTNIRYVIADHNIRANHGNVSCSILENSSYSKTEALLRFIKINSPDVCVNEDTSYPNNEVAWSYQVCTEFGFSITMTSRKQPFNDDFSVIDSDMESCLEFGEEFTLDLLKKGINRINRNYASQQISVSKVLSVHGTQDPWYKLGLYEQRNEDAPVILIPGTSHCADQLLHLEEPAHLTKAKKTGRKILTKWLSN